MELQELRKVVCDANISAYRQDLTFLGRGEVSGFDRDKHVMVVKPASIPHSQLTPDHMLVIDFSGNLLEGNDAPSPDAITHLYLAQAFTDVMSLVSSYSMYAGMFAHAQRAIPCLGAIHALRFKGEIPVARELRKAEVDRNYEKSLAAVINERFGRLSHQEVPGVLLASHGVVTWGTTVEDALINSIAVERLARMALGTYQLDPSVQPVSTMLIERRFNARR